MTSADEMTDKIRAEAKKLCDEYFENPTDKDLAFVIKAMTNTIAIVQDVLMEDLDRQMKDIFATKKR